MKFSETDRYIRAKSYGKLPIHIIFRSSFLFFQHVQFSQFLPVILTRGPMGGKFMIITLVMGKYRLILFGDLPRIKKYHPLKFLLTHHHMRLKISQHYFSYSFHLISAKLDEDNGLPYDNTGHLLWQSDKSMAES